MDLNSFTVKAQEAIQGSATIAARYHHQQIDCEHLVLALLEQDDGLALRLLEKIGISPGIIQQELEKHLSELPRVSSTGSDQVYMSQNLNRVFDTAKKEANQMKDDYISVEHLLLALIKETDSISSKILLSAGVTRDNLTQAISEVRGDRRVTIPQP